MDVGADAPIGICGNALLDLTAERLCVAVAPRLAALRGRALRCCPIHLRPLKSTRLEAHPHHPIRLASASGDWRLMRRASSNGSKCDEHDDLLQHESFSKDTTADSNDRGWTAPRSLPIGKSWKNSAWIWRYRWLHIRMS